MKYLFLVTFLSFVFTKFSYACSCVDPNEMEVKEFADFVILGEVKSNQRYLSFSQNRYKFKVNETLLGKESKEMIIWSDKYTSSCGAPYKKGVEYLVIILADGNKNYSGLCSSWNSKSESAKVILKNLETTP